MPACWIDEFLASRSRSAEAAKTRAELRAVAVSHSDAMVRRLYEQLSGDVAKYVAATGKQVVVEALEAGFRVRHDSPLFLIEAEVLQEWFEGPRILCRETHKLSEGPLDLFRDHDILIVAKGPEAVYYHVHGEDYGDPSDVSEILLSPMFQYLGL